jgi:hypothetical protein
MKLVRKPRDQLGEEVAASEGVAATVVDAVDMVVADVAEIAAEAVAVVEIVGKPNLPS